MLWWPALISGFGRAAGVAFPRGGFRTATALAQQPAHSPHGWRQESNLQRGLSAGLLFNPELRARTNQLCYAMRVVTGYRPSQAPTLA